ncbi:equilibrative nucleoside transporter 3-like isoform X2 [Gigantopelta aegis]|uniref:equilibrative nucleoside transporter 3-like isoform X2 n=1 Tax=Gigantopelta aegis TaxID=1735272 RepID=UPI001B887EBD|nr:equilibrative nucleoside transporter 3-like isoform X2 [Gigantopelta aegis]
MEISQKIGSSSEDEPTECNVLLASSEHGVSSVKHPIVPDRFYGVYFIFLFLGMASLLPWNFFITAKSYFQFKLRNTSIPASEFNDPDEETNLQILFESYLATSSTITNLTCVFLTAIFVRKIPLKVRMIASLCLVICLFGLTSVLVKLDSNNWQKTFFIVTIASAAVINGGTAILTGSIFGFSCRFPRSYTQACMMGQAIGGTFAAVAGILALAGGSSVIDSAFGYFLTATVISVVSLLAYILLYYLPFSKYHMTEVVSGVKSINNDESHTVPQGHCEFYGEIIKQIWKQGVCVCIVFTITLACFPAVSASIRSVTYVKGDSWTDKYFTPVICFLLFNLGDWVGRTATSWISLPSDRHSYIMLLLCCLRVAFIPLLMFCNAEPRSHLNVVFDHDAWPITFILLLGLTNGYFGTRVMIYAPQRVTWGQAEAAGVIMAFMLTLGLALGSGLSFLIVKLL